MLITSRIAFLFASFFVAVASLAVVGCGSSSSPTGATDPSVAGDPDPTGTPTPMPGSTNPTPAPTADARGHHRCGWIGAGDTVGMASFIAHADWFDAIHPDWYALQADGTSLRPLARADDPALTAAARAHGVKLIPLIASVEKPDYTRLMLNDPARRAAHVKNLVELATSRGYDGVELDYEKLWSAADRAPMTAFITELATAMHAAGKQVSLAIPSLPTENTRSAWDVPALAAVADTIHVMGYDLHSLGTHSGPVSPVGWIDATLTRMESTGHAGKFVLALANYGVTPSWFGTNRAAVAACGPGYATTTDHMASCPYGVYEAGRAPHCSSSHGEIYFEDLGSLEEKVAAAARHHIGGITYWTVGDEIDGFFEMVERYF